MRIQPEPHCDFWNVGQGLFSSEKFINGADVFTWVYDCDSSSKGQANLLKNAVSKMSQSYPKEIDLLAISHFDKDHTNGLTYFSQSSNAVLNDSYSASTSSPNSYTLINADLDTKKVSGSSVSEFYDNNEKVGQAEISFKESTLYINNRDSFSFKGSADGRIQVKGQDSEAISGTYNGSVYTYGMVRKESMLIMV